MMGDSQGVLKGPFIALYKEGGTEQGINGSVTGAATLYTEYITIMVSS